jgi:hypothetical protein
VRGAEPLRYRNDRPMLIAVPDSHESVPRDEGDGAARFVRRRSVAIQACDLVPNAGAVRVLGHASRA